MSCYPLLFLDPETERKIYSTWEALNQVGYPYPHHSLGLRPHITLAEFQALDTDGATEKLERIARQTSAIDVSFHNLGIFLTPHPVVFLAPTVTHGLLDFHARVIGELSTDSSATLAGNDQVGKWIPHVTLAINFPAERLNEMLDICRQISLPLHGQVVACGLINYPPLRQLSAVAFQVRSRNPLSISP